jgi:hypothetical protein
MLLLIASARRPRRYWYMGRIDVLSIAAGDLGTVFLKHLRIAIVARHVCTIAVTREWYAVRRHYMQRHRVCRESFVFSVINLSIISCVGTFDHKSYVACSTSLMCCSFPEIRVYRLFLWEQFINCSKGELMDLMLQHNSCP